MKRKIGGILTAAIIFCMILTACSGSSGTTAFETTAEAVIETEVLAPAAEPAGGNYVPGTYIGQAQGFGGLVTVSVTVDDSSIIGVTTKGDNETEAIGGAALPELAEQILDAQSADIDGVSGASLTSAGVREAAAIAIAAAEMGQATSEGGGGAVTFGKPGTYLGTGEGYNAPVTLSVTFSENAITSIEVAESEETAHIGDVAYDIMFADAMEAVGAGIDSVSGATFTSRAVKEALNDAAAQAGVSDASAFAVNTVAHEAEPDIEVTRDVVVVGSGGAGMGAAAQAAQNGETVLVIEENAEIGGNTLASGGAFQSAMGYLCWDPDDPDATTAVWDYNGQTYPKVMSVQGCIDTLRTILNWSEEPFDESYYETHEFVAGDIDELSRHGVHREYLPTLKALKEEISEYLLWADPKLANGIPEGDITLFSTVNLHIFQTYYGGLRPSSDMTGWNYGDFELVSQFISEGQLLKTWLEDQGAMFDDASQSTLIGALWYRENSPIGGDLDGDGVAEEEGNWGTYFYTMRNTLLETSPTADKNEIMLRTTAKDLLLDESGRVVGVHAVRYDGTEVYAYAEKGVVLATGGYAANISRVIETNEYWDPAFINSDTETTNRSTMQGDGIDMAEAAGAGTVGMGWTQMMPISWIDNGDLAYGSGTNCIYINPTTGLRFVNEAAERDVLSLGEFRNGIEVNGTQGVFMEFANAGVPVGSGYHWGDGAIEGRVYIVEGADGIQEVLDAFGMEADPEVILDTIEAYDRAVMAGEQPEVEKSQASAIIGNVETDELGNYLADTYDLDGTTFRIRIMAPSTHHTMGGLTTDTERHVLDTSGRIIEGLYAAGEVTGGIHGGNRLGGNAIVEVIVSGRTAAAAIEKDN